MLEPERALPRARARLVRRPAHGRDARIRRCSIWLDGNQNVKGRPNENYARELMELFTLGADRGAYTETDVREQARALTGWRGDASTGRIDAFRFDPAQPRHGHEDDLRPDRQLRLAGRVRPLPGAPAAPVVLRARSSGATSSRRRPTRRPSTGSRRSTRRRQIRPVVEAILKHPDFYTGPRDGEAAGRLQRRACCGRSAAAIDTTTWWSLGQSAGQQLFYPPDVGGWDYTRWLDTATFRARWFIAALVQGAGAADRRAERPGAARSTARSQFWGFADDHAADRRRCLTAFAARRSSRARPRRRRRDRAAPARRHVPRPPDRHERYGCRDCNRTELLRRAVAEAGRGLPAIEAGMPLPAGTGMTRRSFVSRAAGLALAVYGGSALSSRRVRATGSRRRRADAATQRVARLGLPRRRDRLAVGAVPGGRPAVLRAPPDARARADRGPRRSPRTRRLRWHPAAGGLATLHGEGKVSVLPAIGYDNSDKSHFTSRHYWEVGATDATLRTGWLGRYLDRVGAPDNPLQGLSLDIALQPALATAKMPVATLAGGRPVRLRAAGRCPRTRSRRR